MAMATTGVVERVGSRLLGKARSWGRAALVHDHWGMHAWTWVPRKPGPRRTCDSVKCQVDKKQ